MSGNMARTKYFSRFAWSSVQTTRMSNVGFLIFNWSEVAETGVRKPLALKGEF
jgi:hypothetical protein